MIYLLHGQEVTAMNYILMHKEIPVVEMSLDEATGAVQKVGNAYHLEHLPIGILMKKSNIIDRTALNT